MPTFHPVVPIFAVALTILLGGCGESGDAGSTAPRGDVAEGTAAPESSLFFTEGAPVGVGEITGIATLASGDEIRIRIAELNNRSMLPYARASAVLPGREDAPLSATRSANDLYLSIRLPEPATLPLVVPITVVDARTGAAATSTANLDKIVPSDADTQMRDVVTTGTPAQLAHAVQALTERISRACAGGDYELTVSLIPVLADVAGSYAASRGMDDPATLKALATIRDAHATLTKAAAEMDDGVMGTTVEILQYDVIPSLTASEQPKPE